MTAVALLDVVAHDRLGRRHVGRRGRIREMFRALDGDKKRELLDLAGSEIESQTRRRITEEKKSPDGSAWPEWSEAYERRRPKKGGMLELSGDLVDSLTYNVLTDAVEIGSNLVYARRHQVGKRMPKREFIGLSDENMKDLGELVRDWLGKELWG